MKITYCLICLDRIDRKFRKLGGLGYFREDVYKWKV